MKSTLIAGAALAALSLAACSKPADKTDAAATPAATDAAATAPAAPAAAPAAAAATPVTAADFVTKAASSDMFEITEAKLAASKAASADVKAFAKMMITDHTKSTANLKAAIAKSGQTLALPTALPADLQAKVDILSKTTGKDFDKAYVDQQVDAHTDTLAAMKGYASAGDVPALKDFATATAPVVQTHLDKVKGMQGAMK